MWMALTVKWINMSRSRFLNKLYDELVCKCIAVCNFFLTTSQLQLLTDAILRIIFYFYPNRSDKIMRAEISCAKFEFSWQSNQIHPIHGSNRKDARRWWLEDNYKIKELKFEGGARFSMNTFVALNIRLPNNCRKTESTNLQLHAIG